MYWLKKSPPPEKGAVTLSSGLGVVCHCKQQNLCVCVSVCKATTFQLEGEKSPGGYICVNTCCSILMCLILCFALCCIVNAFIVTSGH